MILCHRQVHQNFRPPQSTSLLLLLRIHSTSTTVGVAVVSCFTTHRTIALRRGLQVRPPQILDCHTPNQTMGLAPLPKTHRFNDQSPVKPSTHNCKARNPNLPSDSKFRSPTLGVAIQHSLEGFASG